MGQQYSDQEIRAFGEKDLRIVRQNALAHATKIMTTGDPYGQSSTKEEFMNDLFNIASSCVAFVYEGMQFPLEKTAAEPEKTRGPANEVLLAIATEAGIPTEMLDSLEAEIVRVFGKLPSNMKSVPKVISSIELENVT